LQWDIRRRVDGSDRPFESRRWLIASRDSAPSPSQSNGDIRVPLDWLGPQMLQYREERPGLIAVALYTAAESAAIVRDLKSLPGWMPALVREAQDAVNYEIFARPEVRSASTMVSSGSQKIYQEFDARMNATLKPLINAHWQVDLPRHSATHILRYGPGDHYVPHLDTGPGFEDRYLSIVCYLNDDFAGGHTSFPGLNHSVVPESGKAIVFPSHYLHGSEPVTQGEKFVVVSWVNGPAPVKWI